MQLGSRTAVANPLKQLRDAAGLLHVQPCNEDAGQQRVRYLRQLCFYPQPSLQLVPALLWRNSSQFSNEWLRGEPPLKLKGNLLRWAKQL